MIQRISLLGDATKTIIRAAAQGYDARYKEERLGILLGRVSRGVALVEQAVIYRGGERTRTAASVDPYRFERRVKTLQKELGLVFLGSFHTHNEVAGSISSALSQADKTPLCENPPSLIEMIAAIWASDGAPWSAKFYLQGRLDEYRFRVAGYACQQGFKCLPVSSKIA